MRRYLTILAFLCLTAGPALAQPPGGAPGGPDSSVKGGEGRGPEIRSPGPRSRSEFYPLQRLFSLDLTAEQRNRLCGEAYESSAKINLLRAEMANAQLRLACLQNQEKVDESQVREAFAKSAKVQADLFLAEKAYTAAVRAVLTKEQWEELQRPFRPAGQFQRQAPGGPGMPGGARMQGPPGGSPQGPPPGPPQGPPEGQ